jgi:hypothetical protein
LIGSLRISFTALAGTADLKSLRHRGQVRSGTSGR